VGAIGVRKGHFDIVQAAIRMGAEAPFVFLFVGSDEYGGETARLREEIDRHGVDGMIEFLGPLTGDAKWTVLAGADVFLLPAYNENMPNSILEAMAAGLPVVCTDVGAVRQMVGNAGALIVPTGDPDAIAAALEGLRRDPAGRRIMGDANRQRSVEEYSFDRVARDLDDLYERYAPRAPHGGKKEERVPTSTLGHSEIPRTH
jgi:glycosyltransferase involved in cell wall biosynthesis